VNVGTGVFVGKGVDVGAANPGILPQALSSIMANKAKYGKRFMVDPP
jgi:hypothetical protein